MKKRLSQSINYSLPQAVPVKKMNYHRQVRLLILFFSAVRLALAATFELGNDEAYYWLYTQKLQWNYFDHPPMVAVLGRLFTLNGLLDQSAIFMRLGSIVSCGFATWFLYKATSLLYTEKAGWYAAFLYNVSFYAGIVAGLFLMPDSPQMLFYTFSIWMFARVHTDDRNWKNWLLFGMAAGLCVLSKVHGAFIGIGLIAYTLIKKREWLKNPYWYLSLGVAAILISPIFIWNVQNDFVTYRFQSQRVTLWGAPIQLKTFVTELLGQLLFNNPVVVALTIWALRENRQKKQPEYFLLYTGLPLIVILLIVSLFRSIYPHWSGPGYVALLPVAANYLAGKNKHFFSSEWIRWSGGIFLLFTILWPLIIHFYPGTWGSKKINYGWGDVSLDRYGWKRAAKEFALYYQDKVNQQLIAANTPVICPTWWGAHIEYYFCHPYSITMLGVGPMYKAHHYLWLNKQRMNAANLQTALCIVPSDEYYDVAKVFAPYYRQAKRIHQIKITRSNQLARIFYIYQLTGWQAKEAKNIMYP